MLGRPPTPRTRPASRSTAPRDGDRLGAARVQEEEGGRGRGSASSRMRPHDGGAILASAANALDRREELGETPLAELLRLGLLVLAAVAAIWSQKRGTCATRELISHNNDDKSRASPSKPKVALRSLSAQEQQGCARREGEAGQPAVKRRPRGVRLSFFVLVVLLLAAVWSLIALPGTHTTVAKAYDPAAGLSIETFGCDIDFVAGDAAWLEYRAIWAASDFQFENSADDASITEVVTASNRMGLRRRVEEGVPPRLPPHRHGPARPPALNVKQAEWSGEGEEALWPAARVRAGASVASIKPGRLVGGADALSARTATTRPSARRAPRTATSPRSTPPSPRPTCTRGGGGPDPPARRRGSWASTCRSTGCRGETAGVDRPGGRPPPRSSRAERPVRHQHRQRRGSYSTTNWGKRTASCAARTTRTRRAACARGGEFTGALPGRAAAAPIPRVECEREGGAHGGDGDPLSTAAQQGAQGVAALLLYATNKTSWMPVHEAATRTPTPGRAPRGGAVAADHHDVLDGRRAHADAAAGRRAHRAPVGRRRRRPELVVAGQPDVVAAGAADGVEDCAHRRRAAEDDVRRDVRLRRLRGRSLLGDRRRRRRGLPARALPVRDERRVPLDRPVAPHLPHVWDARAPRRARARPLLRQLVRGRGADPRPRRDQPLARFHARAAPPRAPERPTTLVPALRGALVLVGDGFADQWGNMELLEVDDDGGFPAVGEPVRPRHAARVDHAERGGGRAVG